MPPSDTSWGPSREGEPGRTLHLSSRDIVVGGRPGTQTDKPDQLGAVPGADSGRGPLLAVTPLQGPTCLCPQLSFGASQASCHIQLPLPTAPFTSPTLLHQHTPLPATTLCSVDDEGMNEPCPCPQELATCVVWGRPAGSEGRGPRAPSSYRGSDVASLPGLVMLPLKTIAKLLLRARLGPHTEAAEGP